MPREQRVLRVDGREEALVREGEGRRCGGRQLHRGPLLPPPPAALGPRLIVRPLELMVGRGRPEPTGRELTPGGRGTRSRVPLSSVPSVPLSLQVAAVSAVKPNAAGRAASGNEPLDFGVPLF